MKFGDFLVVVTVWLLCLIAVFGHPSSSKNELQTQKGTEVSSDMVRILQELESVPENGTDHQPRHVRSESEILDDILKVLIESYQSEVNKKGNYEPMQGDQPLWLNGTDDQSKERMREEIHLQMMKET